MIASGFIPKLGPMFWQKLYAFYYVVRLKSYSRAAQHLSLSQASLTKAVQALEERLEMPLLLRNTRGIMGLTETGQHIFERMASIIAELEVLEHSLEPMERATLALSLRTEAWILSDYLIHGLMQFKKERPGLVLQLQAPAHIQDSVDPNVDVTIRCGVALKSDEVQKPLFSFSLGYYASRNYLRMHGKPSSLSDLARHRIYSYGKSLNLFNQNHIDSKKSSDSSQNDALEIYSATCLFQIAAADLGIIQLMKNNPALQDRFLVPILDECLGPNEQQGAVYFCCAKKTWERLEIQALYESLRDTLKHTTNHGSVTYSAME